MAERRPKARSWEEMREWQVGLLERSTGDTLQTWNDRIHGHGFADEGGLRDWLRERDVTGYSQMLLVHETFGYPEFFTKTADQLIEDQYADRPQLRPVLDAVLDRAAGLDDVTLQTRKTYVCLVGPRRTFAVVKASTRRRADLGLRLPGREPGGRLLAARSLGTDLANVRVALSSPDEVDDEVAGLLAQAYDANL